MQPVFDLVGRPDGTLEEIRARGNGHAKVFGYASCPVRLEGGKSYRLSIRFDVAGMDRPEPQVVHGIYASNFSAGVVSLTRSGAEYRGEAHFDGPGQGADAETAALLPLRAAGRGVLARGPAGRSPAGA